MWSCQWCQRESEDSALFCSDACRDAYYRWCQYDNLMFLVRKRLKRTWRLWGAALEGAR